MTEEIWKDIPEYTNLYTISNLGRIKDRKSRVMKFDLTKKGYQRITLRKMGHLSRQYVHRLVLSVFVRLPKAQEQCNHIDGNKANNRISNLEWVTAQQNIRHSFKKLGRIGPRGERSGWFGVFAENNPRSKKYIITKPDGKEIPIHGLTQFCKKNGLSAKTMSRIATGNGENKTHRGGWKCRYDN